MNKTVQSAPGAGGSGTPGGSDTQVQFNDGGAFNGEAAFNYDKTNDQLTVPGLTITQDQFYSGVISPAQITADQNNYNPTGLSTAAVLRLSSDASRNITGIEGGESGRVLYVMNVGAFNIVLINQSLSSTNVNRLDLFADTTIAKDCGVLLFYDGTDSRWRLCALTGASTVAGSDTQVQFNNAGSFGAEADFTYNSTTNKLFVNGEVEAVGNGVVGGDLSVAGDTDLAGGATAFVSVGAGTFRFDSLNTPAQFTANQNNYTPATAAVIYRLSSDASRDVTGWNEPLTGNQVIILHNIGSNNIVFKDESGSSSANNRFALSGDYTLGPEMTAIMVYDNTSFRWRFFNQIVVPLTVAQGGTGAATLADAGVLVGNGTSAITVVANGTDGQVFKAQGGTTDPAWEDDFAAIPFIIDGGGATITTGIKGDLEVPFACVITRATLLADQSGSIVIDVWKDTYANFAPTDADSITASAPPTISSAIKSQDTTLTGWTTTLAAGDILRFNVDSVTSIQRVTLSLRVRKT